MVALCVQSLLSQCTQRSYEIIVLDQSDHKNTAAIYLDHPRLRIIGCDFKNKSRALNLGVTIAKAPLIAVIDDDCIAHEKWIDEMYSELIRNTTAVVTGRVIAGELEPGAVRSRLHDSVTNYITFHKGMITPIFIMSGCNFGFSKEIFKAIGPFDESFGPGAHFRSSDDNEWSYRALNRGHNVLYSPNAIVYHRSWRDKERDTELMRNYGYAAGAFFRLIYNASKFNFIYHSLRLLFWLARSVLLAPCSSEAKNHRLYGRSFIIGFFSYHRYASTRKAN